MGILARGGELIEVVRSRLFLSLRNKERKGSLGDHRASSEAMDPGELGKHAWKGCGTVKP